MKPTGGAGVLIIFSEGAEGVKEFFTKWEEFNADPSDNAANDLSYSLREEIVESIVEVHEMDGNPFEGSQN